MTEHEEGVEYDPRAFRTLLGSTDATLLSPLFERAASALKVFIQEGPQPDSSIEFDAHKLKTTCLQLGLPRLSNILDALETAAREGDSARCDALSRMLQSEYSQVASSLEKYAAQLASAARPSA